MFVTKKKYNKLEQEVERLNKLLNMPQEERVEYYKNNLSITYETSTDALKAWAQIITSAFIEMGAPNYIEMTLGSGVDKYVCTVRKYFGKTPDQCRKEAEAKLQEAEARLEVVLANVLPKIL